ENALRQLGFSRFTPPETGTPSEVRDKYLSRADELDAEITRLESEVAALKEREKEFRLLRDALSVKKAVLEARPNFRSDGTVVWYKGYCTSQNAEKLEKAVPKRFSAAVTVSDPAPDEDVPVVLKNNGFASPLEGITAMYSLPGKDDIDPTGVMAFFYYFFFGMMFSDGGYGLMMTLACAFALIRFGKTMTDARKSFVKMYLFCGISTTFWGAMYGSWFGDMINVVREDVLFKPPITLALWKDPLQDLLSVLVVCFIFGLVHLFTGVLISGINSWRHGKKFDAFCQTVPTFLMVLGLAPIFFSLFTDVPSWMDKVKLWLLIPGVVLVILTGGRESKGIGGKIALGLYSVYDLFGGYLGDVLSYARLLALGLATGVIAQVINMLCVLPGSPALRVVMLIVVGAVGHIANFGINVIGAYVHTNRLQYVEFFGKFYTGGGRPLEPVKGDTRYYTVKEEN
ncbi:MAG: V-type ATP synthase subunit I, partial [Clostridia bacterium]|nr:V-type ATP synthase subunit I [Clostridia bacterium]